MAVLHDKMCAHTHTIISCTFQLVLLTKRHPWDFDWMCVISSITQLEEQTILVKKSLSEALIFASTNPQYDNKLFIVHENCKLRIPAEHVVYTNCFLFRFDI